MEPVIAVAILLGAIVTSTALVSCAILAPSRFTAASLGALGFIAIQTGITLSWLAAR